MQDHSMLGLDIAGTFHIGPPLLNEGREPGDVIPDRPIPIHPSAKEPSLTVEEPRTTLMG